ncbi:MAG TPA: cation-translocating P-type ATPase C-terminal domain-containing protein, partial [Acidimicrobiales bacterium]|nr:cation-translocating P-type ATPase C-terminal domain-containing protein [Acidimicrobiales bacterium]
GTMAAFFVSCAAAGWSPGQDFPTGPALAAASGAAFMTVVVAQTANAFACRSATLSVAAMHPLGNRLLPAASAVELGVSLVMLLWEPAARALEHASPPLEGWLVAGATAAVLLGADAVDKAHRRRTQLTRASGPP